MILGLQPKSVLDLGSGFGKFGVLTREYTDIWNGTYEPKDWKVRIDGVEGFTKYIQNWHYEIYSNIYICNILDFIPNIKYDLILMIDVLEHFTGEQGEQVLKMIIENSESAIITTPVQVMEQNVVNNNKFEIHRSQWTSDGLIKYGNVFIISNTFFLNTGKQLFELTE